MAEQGGWAPPRPPDDEPSVLVHEDGRYHWVSLRVIGDYLSDRESSTSTEDEGE